MGFDIRFTASRLGAILAVLLVAAVHAPAAQAQSDPAAGYPSRPIRIVVGFAAGGATDIFARLISPKMFRESGQPMLVENKTGAGGMIAAEYIAKATPDGYTLFMSPTPTMTVNPAVYTKIAYSPLRDFAPVSIISSYPYLLVANKAAGVNNIQELIAYAKANPKKANNAGASPVLQLLNVLFNMVTGAQAEYIGYKSTAESVSAVMAGEVLMTLSDTPALMSPLRSGRVVGLAVTSKTRLASFPDIPTMAELGLPRLEASSSNGVFAPAGTPPAIIDKIEREFIRIIRLPDVREKFDAMAAEPVGSTAEEYRRVIASDLERWTAVAKAGNVRIDR